MDYPHGDIVVLDMAIGVSDFFVKLVSRIYQGGHEPIETVMVREFDALIGSSGVELGSGTLGFVERF